MVDIDEMVMEACNKFMPTGNLEFPFLPLCSFDV